MNFFAELKRRNVFRMGLLYVVSSWLLLQTGDILFNLMGLPDWSLRLLLGILVLGFPFALVVSWVYELTPEGLRRESELDGRQSPGNTAQSSPWHRDFELGDAQVSPKLNRIARDNREITVKPKSMAVLVLLADARGEVLARNHILDAIWPAMDVTDDVLTQSVVELRKAFDDDAKDPRIIETVPRVGFRLVPTAVTERKTGHKLYLAVGAMLAVSIGLTVYGHMSKTVGQVEPNFTETDSNENSTPAVASTPDANSIAVLPFLNLSADPEQEYFSDGLAESLLHLLAQIRELRVAARTSSFRFKDHSTELAEIGRQLNVANVLEGSVQRSGDKIRVTAQLISVADGFHLWSGTWDRELDDVFAIQDEIAASVADALKVTLLGEAEPQQAARDTDSLVAYQAYLKGRRHLADGFPERAEPEFRNALAADPDYLLALFSLAQVYIALKGDQISYAEMAVQLQEIVDRIRQVEPESPQATAMTGWIGWESSTDRESVLAPFRNAYEAAPEDEFVAQQYAEVLLTYGLWERSVTVGNRALERDPLSVAIHLRLAVAYWGVREFEKSLVHSAKLRTLAPDNPSGARWQAIAYVGTGQFANALAAFAEARELNPNSYIIRFGEVMLLFTLGQNEAARERIAAAREVETEPFLPLMAEAALRYSGGDLKAAADIVLSAADQGVEVSDSGFFVAYGIMRDYALLTGDSAVLLDDIGDWIEVDFRSGKPGSGRSLLLQLGAAPIMRQAGLHGEIDALIEAVAETEYADWFYARLVIAIAREDADGAIQNLDKMLQEGRGREDWILLRLRSLDFVRDDPRFQALVERIDNHNKQQWALWLEMNRETGEAAR
ncbi:MAG: winged helix-turn-helix domain-containing protein [Xanthomonadales bacterium]|nr:winged helix-turn-helix domain-containing protein [Xanthomonadales bacterium]